MPPAGMCEPLVVRDIVWRDMSEDRVIWDEFRERDVSEDMLPFETMLPSPHRGEPGTTAVAAPFCVSGTERPKLGFEVW